jgi:putative membrane protein
MGAADIVPGVSGGTVALVLGIYERLIANVRRGAHGLRAMVTGDLAGASQAFRQIEWVWVGSLLAGILAAVLALASVLERLLDEQPIRMAALFFGLVAGSVWVALRLIGRIDRVAIALIAGVAISVFLLLGLRTDTAVADNAAEVVTEPLWAFFLAGAVAICAMILPGISGSFILVMLGMYTEVLGAVNDRDVAALGVFTLGCVIGLSLFSTLLYWLLGHYHDWVMAAMIGLMLGSTRVLWPWPNGTQTTTLAAPSGDVVVPFLLMIVGVTVVVLVERIATGRVGVTEAEAEASAAAEV